MGVVRVPPTMRALLFQDSWSNGQDIHESYSKCPHQESNLGCRGHDATSYPLDEVDPCQMKLSREQLSRHHQLVNILKATQESKGWEGVGKNRWLR